MNTRPKICTDRILPKDLMRFQPTVSGLEMATRAIAPIGKSWMNGSKLRVKFMGGKTADHNLVKEQFSWWSAVANIHFEFGDDPHSECRITFDENLGAWSYLGTDCHSIPLDQPTMNLGFVENGTPAHECGHFLSLAHEHSSPHGGIQWNEAVVLRDAAKSPNFWDEATTRHNILHKYSLDQINGTALDVDSIMMYWFPKEWTTNGVGTKQNEALSATDKMFIGGAKMYPKTGVTVSGATKLTVNGPSVEASIGQIGEEDLYVCHVDADGQYVIETGGFMDSVINLYGPDSETALIATDDDSGIGLASRIVRGLIAGKYYTQVRHWNRLKGVGKYSIRVTKT